MIDVAGPTVFFNRPGHPVPIHRLREDMRAARIRIGLASAWFTDDETATAFVSSSAELKVAVLSAADLKRDGSSTAVDLLRSAPGATVAIVGTGNWQAGVMHHKFVVTDDVVWFGSYNFTHQARRNYETLVRMESPGLAETFWAEATYLAGLTADAGLSFRVHLVPKEAAPVPCIFGPVRRPPFLEGEIVEHDVYGKGVLGAGYYGDEKGAWILGVKFRSGRARVMAHELRRCDNDLCEKCGGFYGEHETTGSCTCNGDAINHCDCIRCWLEENER